MKKYFITFVIIGVLGVIFNFIPKDQPVSGDIVRLQSFFSPPYKIDKKFKSMMGPYKTQKIYLEDPEKQELLWITGYQAEIVDAEKKTPMPPDFMCHSNLDYDVKKHKLLFGWKQYPSPRLFTLSQGRLDVKFPEGYGVPIVSGKALTLNTQALNHNIENPDIEVRVKSSVQYVRDKDLKQPIHPLTMSTANGLVLVDGKDGVFDIGTPDPKIHGRGSDKGEAVNFSEHYVKDHFGRKFSAHWVVPPGKHEYRSLVTQFMRLPYDTTLHYAAAHLHPFAESVELWDRTENKSILKILAKNRTEGIGLTQVNSYSDKKGIPLYQYHQYDLITVYNNLSGQNQTVMSVMFLYIEDKEFKKPNLSSGFF
jgi:hypothetical protein